MSALLDSELILAFREGDEKAIGNHVCHLLTALTFAGVNEKWDHYANVMDWLNRHGLTGDPA